MQSPFKVGDLVKIKAEYGPSTHYGIIMQIGYEGNWELDDRFVRVIWAGGPGAKIRGEKIRHLTLVATT
tara:strand:+ start:399 stop:605 length:207 start_codon:yes stop_codon:yes gene_type:complete